MSDTLARLAALIETRKHGDQDTSGTAQLLSKGVDKTAEKFGEEAVEAIDVILLLDRKLPERNAQAA